MTINNNDLDIEGTFIYLAPSYARVLINDYKKVKTYGGKSFNIKSTKFYKACFEFLDGDTDGKYLIDEEKASNLSHIVKRHTFDGVGEAIYFKTIVLNYAKNSKIKNIISKHGAVHSAAHYGAVSANNPQNSWQFSFFYRQF